MTMTKERFHPADYVVLVLFLVLSSLIGVVFGIRDRKKMTSATFFSGGGNTHWALVAFSMQASFMSSIFLLSMPVEIYAWGTTYFYLVIAYLVAPPLSGHFIMAIFYKLQFVSAYEYLETRFNKSVRTACAACFLLQIFLYMSVVLYSPALALAQVTGLTVTLSIIICGLVCTFYTVVGGMKATIWNDFIQVGIIGLTLVLLVILGVLRVGGFKKMWDLNVRGGRIIFDDFQIDPRIRTTFWTQTVGGMFFNFSTYASSQTSIQKFAGVGTLRGAKKSVLLSSLSTAVFFTLVCLIGLATHAFYAECDPLLGQKIEKIDQLIPQYIMEVMGHLPGLPGLFIAAVFSAALSSLSGNLNAMTAVTLTDFVCPLYLKVKKTQLDEKIKVLLSRVLTLIFGLVVIGMGFAARSFGDVVVQVAFSIFGFVGTPLTCAIVGGMLLPFVNSIGTMCGLFSSLIVASWVAIGSKIFQHDTPKLPMGSNCSSDNLNVTTLASPIGGAADEALVMNVYKISHMYYGVIAMVIYLIVAIPVSLITGRNKSVDRRLVIDWFEQCFCCLPRMFKGCLKCGVQFIDEEEDRFKLEKISHSIYSCMNEFAEKNEMTIKVLPPSESKSTDSTPDRESSEDLRSIPTESISDAIEEKKDITSDPSAIPAGDDSTKL